VTVADAARLPLASQSISLVVASMSLQDFDDLAGAIGEAGRVLVPGGGFSMTFTSMHRPLGAYIEALSGVGLAITALREYGDRAIPWLLALRAENNAAPAEQRRAASRGRSSAPHPCRRSGAR
jgi:ubiquinone/menaquinone biosynthesis C-methylase UbiE